jgi:hypothetical protein
MGSGDSLFAPVPTPFLLSVRQPQPLQRMGCRITGRWNFFLGLETAHGFEGLLIVYAGHFAGIEAALFERLLNLERARLIDFKTIAFCEKGRVGI